MPFIPELTERDRVGVFPEKKGVFAVLPRALTLKVTLTPVQQ